MKVPRNSAPLFVWFTTLCVAYYYKPALCGGVAHGMGARPVCDATVRGVSVNHWIEVGLYGPLMWLALHRVKQLVFRDAQGFDEPRVLARREFVADAGIALMLYGFGLHVANVIEIYSRRNAGISSGGVYRLTYFLDEDLSHYVIQLALFFVLGWLIMHDRPDRADGPLLAVVLGVVHGVERGVSFVEAGKWFFALPVLLWLLFAMAVRWQRHGRSWRRCRRDFFFRYSSAFVVMMPVSVAWYRLTFRSFMQPSHLPRGEDPVLAVGMFVLTVIGLVVLLVASQLFERRSEPPAPVAIAHGEQRSADDATAA